MSLLDNYGVRREPEGPEGQTILAVSEGGLAIEGIHDERYTQDAKGVWFAEDGTKAPEDWQAALTDWAKPVPPPEPLADPEVNVVVPEHPIEPPAETTVPAEPTTTTDAPPPTAK